MGMTLTALKFSCLIYLTKLRKTIVVWFVYICDVQNIFWSKCPQMSGRSEKNLHSLVLLCEVEIRTGVYCYIILHASGLSAKYGTIQICFDLLMCVSHTAHVIDIGWTSVSPFVCLSVRPSVHPSISPSHAGIVSKRLNLSSNCLHCLVAPWF